jgi:hypothetical protein
VSFALVASLLPGFAWQHCARAGPIVDFVLTIKTPADMVSHP